MSTSQTRARSAVANPAATRPTLRRGLIGRHQVAPARVQWALSALALTGAAALTACSSTSSAGSERPSSSVATKQAALALMHIDLQVINQTGRPLTVKVCESSGGSTCTFDGELQNAQKASVQSEGQPGADVSWPDGTKVSFAARNPLVGTPQFIWEWGPGTANSESQTLVEGEVQSKTFNGHDFNLERPGDTDYKEMVLVVRS